MTPFNPYSRYRQVQVTSTSDPRKLILMLYEACLRALYQAESALNEGNVAAKGEALSKAIAIIAELSVALDRKLDGEIIGFLDSLYRHLLDELTEVNINGDMKRLAHVIRWVDQLREAWNREVIQAGAFEISKPAVVAPPKVEMGGQLYGSLRRAI
jgi:flagellar protein FliS